MDTDGAGIPSAGGSGWRCGRMLQRHPVFNPAGGGRPLALQKGVVE